MDDDLVTVCVRGHSFIPSARTQEACPVCQRIPVVKAATGQVMRAGPHVVLYDIESQKQRLMPDMLEYKKRLMDAVLEHKILNGR